MLSLGLSLWSSTILGRGDPYAVLGIRPELAFDFKTETYRTNSAPTSFSSAITHTRATNATMVDSDGLLKWAPHNLLRYSEQFDNAAWGPSDLSVSTNATVAPDGTTTADKLVENTATDFRFIRQSFSVSDTTRYTASCFVKAAGRGFAFIGMLDSGLSSWASVDLSDGSVTIATEGSGDEATVASEDFGNGWYKISLSALTEAGATTVRIDIRPSPDGIWANRSYTGDGSSGIYVWGAQVYRSDLGGMVNNPDRGDSYVPTTSSAVYLPRRGHHIYNGSAWVNEGLLHESEARTNLYSYSQEFDNAAWAKFNSSVTPNAALAPDGTMTADLWVPASSGTQTLERLVGVSSNTDYTASIFLKAENISSVLVREDSEDGISEAVDLTDGTSSGSNVKSENYGNGWWRFYYTTQVTGVNFTLEVRATGTPNGTDGIYVWGAQLEEGSTPSSYIPTNDSTVIRAAETLTVPTANLPYNASGVSIQMKGLVNYEDEDTAAQVSFWDWSGTDSIFALLDTNSTLTGRVRFRQIAGGTPDQISQAGALSPGINQAFNIAGGYNPTSINGAVNGTSITPDTTPTTMPDTSTNDIDLGVGLMGAITEFRMWGANITDAGREEATT